MKKYLLPILILFLLNCSKKYDEWNIPDNYFTVDVELLNFEQRLKLECKLYFHADYTVKEYALFNVPKPQELGIKHLVIRFFKNGFNYSIFIREINEKYKAFLYKADAIVANTDNIRIYPKSIETNVDEIMFKRFFRGNYEKFVKKKYEKIIIDFSNDVLNLDFFNNIQVLE